MTAGGKITRRRFLSITAAGVLFGGAAAHARPATRRWRGAALGATAEITLRGPAEPTERALAAARQELKQMEALFSLYDSGSALRRLNETGQYARPNTAFLELLQIADQVHNRTKGFFDPSVQPLWRALALTGGELGDREIETLLARVHWPSVIFDSNLVRFARAGMALTFNGIAQGFATDRVSHILARHGFDEVLVNIGEFRAGDGRWRIGVEDPKQGLVDVRTLTRSAIATSSPAVQMLAGGKTGHILHPRMPFKRAKWTTVSVEADNAALADAYSTAFTMMNETELSEMLSFDGTGIRRVLAIDATGRQFRRAL